MAPRRASVIFDMDGVLVDSEPLYQRAWQGGAAAVGFELADEDYVATVGLTEPDGEAHLVELFGDGFDLRGFHAASRAAWTELVEGGALDAKPGAHTLLEALRERGTPIAVATSSPRDDAARSLGSTGLAEFFTHVVTGDQVARGKPAPDIYLEAARRLSVEPRDAVVLEDSVAGAEAGLAAGMTVFIVPDLREPPVHLVERVAGVFPTLAAAMPRVIELVE